MKLKPEGAESRHRSKYRDERSIEIWTIAADSNKATSSNNNSRSKWTKPIGNKGRPLYRQFPWLRASSPAMALAAPFLLGLTSPRMNLSTSSSSMAFRP